MTKVLYVEDDPAQRELMTQLLKLEGLEVSLAKNGEIGVAKAKSWQPDIILMDLRMPSMDGFESIRLIRDEALTVNIPIVVVSAWTSAEHNERAIELGANECITKPFGLNELVSIINSYINRD